MRLTRFALIVPALLALPSVRARAEQEVRPVASRVTAVTVYEDRALVTRTAEAPVIDGVTRVPLEGLPPGLDTASLRASTSGAHVLGVEIEPVHHERANDAGLRAAEEELWVAERGIRQAEMTLDDFENERQTLLSIRAAAAQDAARRLGESGGADIAAMKATLEFVAGRLRELRDEVVSAEARVIAAQMAVDAAQRRLGELKGAGTREELRAIVTLRGTGSGTAPIELSYLIHGASWRPVYAFRVDGDFSNAVLDLGAEVRQSTGEDWEGVALELTTARPSAGASPPDPEAWRIWFPRPRPEESKARRALDAAPAAVAAPQPKQSAGTAIGFLAPSIVRSGLVVAFGAHQKETVRSGARPARVALAQFALAPDVVWTVFPRATDDVYVTAAMTNTTGSPLPAGEARVFVGPDYVGPMALGDWGLDEEVRVGLGVDRQVTAEREALHDERSTEGLFSKETVLSRRYRITVANHRSRAITARVLDQVPVSGDEDLSVKVTEESVPRATLPKTDTETNTARGVLEWRQSVAGGANFELRFGFEVRHPKDRGVIGLD